MTHIPPHQHWLCSPFLTLLPYHPATKSFELWSTPKVLIIHLKKLIAGRKITTSMDIPLKAFDPSPFLAANNPTGTEAHAAAVARANRAMKLAAKQGDDAKDAAGDDDDEPMGNMGVGVDEEGLVITADASRPASPVGTTQSGNTSSRNPALDSTTSPKPNGRKQQTDKEDDVDENDSKSKMDEADEKDAASVPPASPPLYDLVAVVTHLGSAYGGHYIAAALNKRENQWYKFDDSRVTPIKYALSSHIFSHFLCFSCFPFDFLSSSSLSLPFVWCGGLFTICLYPHNLVHCSSLLGNRQSLLLMCTCVYMNKEV